LPERFIYTTFDTLYDLLLYDNDNGIDSDVHEIGDAINVDVHVIPIFIN